MIGALVVHGMIGPSPAFMIDRVGEPSWTAYFLVPVVAAVSDDRLAIGSGLGRVGRNRSASCRRAIKKIEVQACQIAGF